VIPVQMLLAMLLGWLDREQRDVMPSSAKRTAC
jgi:hypothetical protein